MESDAKPKNTQVVICTLLLVATVIVAGIIIYLQHNKIAALTSRNKNLQSSAGDLTDAQAKLKTSNDNLTKSFNTLRDSQKSTSAPTAAKSTFVTETTDTPTPQASASLQINKVQKLTKADFGATTGAADKLRAVNVTMKNLTTSIQSYFVGQFIAITDTGEVIKATLYTNDPGNGNFWNNGQVAAGGSLTEAIPFDITKNIVTLEWTPPGSQPIDLVIPTDQN